MDVFDPRQKSCLDVELYLSERSFDRNLFDKLRLFSNNLTTGKPVLSFLFFALFISWTLRSFFGTAVLELSMSSEMRRKLCGV